MIFINSLYFVSAFYIAKVNTMKPMEGGVQVFFSCITYKVEIIIQQTKIPLTSHFPLRESDLEDSIFFI